MKEANRYNQKRKRNNNNGRKYNNGPNKAHLRAHAQKMYDKYLKDAQMATEPYFQEYYLQHADHYYRVLQELREENNNQHQHQHQPKAAEHVVEGDDHHKVKADDNVVVASDQQDGLMDESSFDSPKMIDAQDVVVDVAPDSMDGEKKKAARRPSQEGGVRRGRKKKMETAPFIAEGGNAPLSMNDLASVAQNVTQEDQND